MAKVCIGGAFAYGHMRKTGLVKWYLTNESGNILTDENGKKLYLLYESQLPLFKKRE